MSPLDKRVAEALTYRFRNARADTYPFPHFYLENIFPDDFYADLARSVSARTDYAPGERHYNGRTFAPLDAADNMDGLRGLLTAGFMTAVLQPFQPSIKKTYGDRKIMAYADLRLIRDGRDYFIGPHTDAPWKLVSVLFYLPLYGMYRRHGTSLYVPNDPDFKCAGGPHYKFEDFTRIYTAPYLPNSVLAFWKNDISFHGVEPVDCDMQRDVLLFNLYDKDIFDAHHRPAAETEPVAETASNAVTSTDAEK